MSTGKKTYVIPVAAILFGLLAIALWFAATLYQIRTTEAFLLNGGTVPLRFDLSVLSQPVAFFDGTLASSTAIAVFCAWTIEVVFVICTVAYEIAHAGILRANKHFTKWFRTATLLLVLFDALTDYLYAGINGIWQQLLFTVIMGVAVFFLGVVGGSMIEYGITEWSH